MYQVILWQIPQQEPRVQMKPQYQQQVLQISDLLQAKILSTEITYFNQMQLDVLNCKSKGKTCFKIPEIYGFKSDQQLKRYLF